MERSHLSHPLMTTLSLDPVLSSAAFWLVAALLVGQLANLVPPRWLATGQWRPPPPVDPRAGLPWIRLWKRWIPDAGGALPGGVPKASLVRRDPEALRRLVVETRRAELVHCLLWPAGLLSALWLPPEGVAVNLVFGTLFNVPCVLVQRFNRQRLRRCLGRMGV